ncbi:Putative uncharacterized transposon-derived protein [Frankliniella fusca]|uniref:Uncharacterized transposon-derived protein n=1 Tax=Frankliniella fusca TaxID=407009 RepID=A0AAE1L7Y6_9NEOP|nr:Putative uncharacterized transposon-derived protein [Frankliniella fusca]
MLRERKKKKITKYLQGEDAYTLHKPARRRFPRNVTYADNIDESWQTDLTDFQSLKKDNDGFSYILCVIDVFSKYGWATPIKDKSGPSIIKGFQTIFKTTDRRPTRLFSDKGKEYINKTFQKFLKENNITYIHTHNPDIKCSIVERWQRTIKSKLFKRFTHTEQYRYVDGLLDDIVDAYNHTYHRSIKMRPVDVTPDRVLETELAQRMELHGHWQAALIELHYPNTIAQVLEGENEITIMSDTFVDTVSVRPGSFSSTDNFVTGIGDALKILKESYEIQYFTLLPDQRCKFMPLTAHDNTKVHFSPRLALQLGLAHAGPYPANEEILGVKPVDISLGVPSQMFIYMDVLEEQIIGHTRAPLLRTVPVDTKAQQAAGNIMRVLVTKKDMVLVHGSAGCSGRSFPFSKAARPLWGGRRPGPLIYTPLAVQHPMANSAVRAPARAPLGPAGLQHTCSAAKCAPEATSKLKGIGCNRFFSNKSTLTSGLNLGSTAPCCSEPSPISMVSY